MTDEFIRMSKVVSDIVADVIGKPDTKRFDYKILATPDLEFRSINLEIETRRGLTNHYFYIDKNEVENAINLLSWLQDIHADNCEYRENPYIKDKREFAHWWEPEEFTDVEIELIDMGLARKVTFDCYDHETSFVWTGEDSELVSLINSLSNIYRIKLS